MSEPFMEQDELIALFGEPDVQNPDKVRENGSMDELYGEHTLPDIVVPPVIQEFLSKREVQQATSQVAFTVR